MTDVGHFYPNILLIFVQKCPNIPLSTGVRMNGFEFLKKVKKYAKDHQLEMQFIADKGKGSHGALILGERRTTLKDRKKEIGPGLLHSMLKDLGIDEL